VLAWQPVRSNNGEQHIARVERLLNERGAIGTGWNADRVFDYAVGSEARSQRR
jgi:hypothetical protein